MATSPQLDILQMLAEWSGPAVVARLPLRPGGVDPLGLRQVNFDLMDRCIPGLNNTATRLRPYALVAWAWWKAAALAKAEIGDLVDPDRLKAYVDRIEVVFAVGHLLENDFAGLLGRDTLNGEVVNRGAYDFSSKLWRDFRVRRNSTTSLMAPVSYGPSAKEGAGLGYLSPRADGAFAPTVEAMPVVHAIEAELSEILDDPCFAALDCGVIEVERMRELYPYWATGALTDVERSVGRDRLCRGARAATLGLISQVLEASGDWLSVGEIRRQMALVAPGPAPANEELSAAPLWRAVQAQQLYRLSLEALMVWLLDTTVSRPYQLVELASLLMDETEHDAGWTFGQWLKAAPEDADQPCDVVPPIADLATVAQSANPGTALDYVRFALAVCREMGSDQRLFGGAADRLPLEKADARAARMAGMPLRDAFEVVLSEWVIGQHLYWAVGRSGDETQRLRLMLDEGGWLAFSAYGNAAPTPDRLATLLSLASDAGILDWDEVDGETVYALAAAE